MFVGEVTIDPWGIVLLLAVLMAAGLVWAVFRERHLIDISREQLGNGQSLANSITLSAATLQMSLDGFSEDLRLLHRQIERSDELTEKHRAELVRLMLDIEVRLGNTIRDLLKERPGIVNQISSGPGAANQAGENHA